MFDYKERAIGHIMLYFRISLLVKGRKKVQDFCVRFAEDHC